MTPKPCFLIVTLKKPKTKTKKIKQGFTFHNLTSEIIASINFNPKKEREKIK